MWLHLLKPLDSLVDRLSMYRLLLYYLIGLLLAAIGLSAAGDVHYSATAIGASALILVTSCWVINHIFAYIFDAPINPESSILTGLILALIIPPSFQNFGFLFMLAAAGLAIASKYIVAIGEKHIFNPAAIAVVLTAIGPHQNASWWVGTAVMLPFVLVGGIMVARKVRREVMVGTFLMVTTLATAIMAVIGKSNLGASMQNMVLSSAVLFLGFVMLTEPYTSPTTKRWQLWYAALVGFLMAPQVHIGHVYTSPEIALVIGNVFAYIVSPKVKLFPILRERVQIAANTFEFAFLPGRKLAYQPGQYIELTLPHSGADSRGSRRWFTLASSPTEEYVRFGVKFYDKGSSFKQAMLKLDRNSQVVAAQVAGDFVMPSDPNKKLVFIAGGIGVTPFRSMVKYLLDKNQRRPVRILYSARTEADFAYKDMFETARRQLGIPTTYVVADRTSNSNSPDTITGMIDADIIRRFIPDYADSIFYISGTHPMVEALQETLQGLGVPHHQLKIDFFPGYA